MSLIPALQKFAFAFGIGLERYDDAFITAYIYISSDLGQILQIEIEWIE